MSPRTVRGAVTERVERDDAIAAAARLRASGTCIFWDISIPGISTVALGPFPWTV